MKKEEIYNEPLSDESAAAPEEDAPASGDAAHVNLADDGGEDPDTMADASPAGGEEQAGEADADERSAADAQAQAAEWKDRCLRLQAEFDNYRKRTLREKMELVERGGADVLKAMLPVADDMDRAVEAMASSGDIEALRAGVELIAQKFREALRSCGVSEIEARGLELDTDRHEAVARFQAGEEQRGKIVDVVQKGYLLRDKVLRFAKVVVGE